MTAESAATSSAIRPFSGTPGTTPHRERFLYRRPGMLLVRVVTLALILTLWEWYAADKSVALLVGPSKIADAFYRMVILDRVLLDSLTSSIAAMIIGLGLAVPSGILLGVLMGRSRTLEGVLDPYVTFLYMVPNVAFVPMLVIMFGIDARLRYALIFLSAVFPILLNTLVGVKHVDRELVDSGRSFCASEAQIVRTIVLPATIPFIFAGIRIGFSAAWVGAIVAEMTATTTGMGGLLLQSASRFRTAEVFVAILGIMAVAIVIQWFVAWLEKRLTPWQRTRTVGH